MFSEKLLAYLYQFLTDERKAQFEKVLQYRTKHFAVALENIYQPHNSNAVIRSCDCFGVQDCHVIETINKFEASKGVSKGAIKWIDVYKYKNSTEAIQTLKNKGYQIVATSPHTNDCSLQDFDIRKKAVFFFGAEKKGLSKEVLDNADVFLKIPMVGHTESLNISVSAAIILQELMQKLRNSNTKWELSQVEKNEILLQWAKRSTKNLPLHLKHFEETER
ncbi:MAG: RNA methyltransferase [Chitinophagales bacterium]|nr:RNA methyltransferase [Chitinophagales bacterium]